MRSPDPPFPGWPCHLYTSFANTWKIQHLLYGQYPTVPFLEHGTRQLLISKFLNSILVTCFSLVFSFLYSLVYKLLHCSSHYWKKTILFPVLPKQQSIFWRRNLEETMGKEYLTSPLQLQIIRSSIWYYFRHSWTGLKAA